MTRRRAAAGLCIAAVLIAAGVSGGLRRALGPLPGAVEPVVVEISEGLGLGQIAARLESAGAIRAAWAFEGLARWRGLDTGLRAGEYEFEPGMDAGEVLERIARGQVRTHLFAVPEGLTAEEIAARLEAAGLARGDAFLRVARDPETARSLGVEGESLEGYLFPETYRLARGLAPLELARTMVTEFHAVWETIAPEARVRGLSMKDAVTLASIIEKETGVPGERPIIASVFLNRLERGMRLETDPTVIYGIQNFDGNLRRVHLEDATNPYNTYRIRGLPPGPIANPGASALWAAVRPAETDYLYFVSRNDGSHHFSRTYREHTAAVDRFQRRRSGR